jgi:hypothetical protein
MRSVFLIAALLTVVGCGSSEFPTAPVSGTVICEGQPVAAAAIYFEPISSGDSALVGKQGFAFSDSEGKFTISTYTPTGGDGAVVGKHRVRVGKGDSNCNCYMNDETDLMQVEVKAGEDNVFELVLNKKTAKDRPVLSDEDDEDD